MQIAAFFVISCLKSDFKFIFFPVRYTSTDNLIYNNKILAICAHCTLNAVKLYVNGYTG